MAFPLDAPSGCIFRREAVSKAMRHSSTVTTETYYGRIRSSQSFAAIDKAFEEQPVSVKTK